jgi:hypothetical protein
VIQPGAADAEVAAPVAAGGDAAADVVGVHEGVPAVDAAVSAGGAPKRARAAGGPQRGGGAKRGRER